MNEEDEYFLLTPNKEVKKELCPQREEIKDIYIHSKRVTCFVVNRYVESLTEDIGLSIQTVSKASPIFLVLYMLVLIVWYQYHDTLQRSHIRKIYVSIIST